MIGCARLVLIAAALLALPACRGGKRGAASPSPSLATTPLAQAGDFSDRILAGGRERSYLVHVPPGAGARRLPLLLAFHGGGGHAAGMDRLTHLNSVADRYGFIVVYPEGIETSWADGRGNTPADRQGVDDVGFVVALLDRLASQVAIDPARVYATGISNGGMFVQRLGCELAQRLAGIFPDAGLMPAPIAPRCRPARPLTVIEVHGTADPLIPYAGGHDRGRGGGGDVLSAEETIALWARLNGCAGTPRTEALPDTAHDGTNVRVETFTGCTGGTSVALYTVENGGHTWPGGLQYLPEKTIGRTTRQFDLSELIGRIMTGMAP